MTGQFAYSVHTNSTTTSTSYVPSIEATPNRLLHATPTSHSVKPPTQGHLIPIIYLGMQVFAFFYGN